MLIYNKETGALVCKIPKCQSMESYFKYHSDEFRKRLDFIILDVYPKNLENYKIVDGDLTKMSDGEMLELKQYGKVLTEDERLLNKLKPSYEEVKKAENTIEILSLLLEVM